MEFSIRTVREEDAESITDMLIPIVQAGTYTIVEEASVESQIDFIRGFPEHGVYHVAVGHGSQKVVGIQDVQPITTGEKPFEHVGEVSTFVSLESHTKGIGRGLCKATFHAARERGFLKIIATIRADNPLLSEPGI